MTKGSEKKTGILVLFIQPSSCVTDKHFFLSSGEIVFYFDVVNSFSTVLYFTNSFLRERDRDRDRETCFDDSR